MAAAIARVCPAWLAADRDDLVQLALMKLMRIREREGSIPRSASYIRKVAYTAVVDEIRRRRRRKEESLDDEVQHAEPTVTSASPEQRAAGRELGQAIQDCLQRLVMPRLLAVTLHLQGHTVPETAEILDCPTKRADNWVYRGLKNLRDCLQRKGLRP